MKVSAVSDGEYVEQELRARGMWSTSHILDAEEYGSPVARIRAWWGSLQGILVAGATARAADFFFSCLLKAFKTPVQVQMEEVIERDPRIRQAICERIGVSSLEGTGIREPKVAEKKARDQKWKDLLTYSLIY